MAGCIGIRNAANLALKVDLATQHPLSKNQSKAAHGVGVPIASPWVNTEAMQAHVDEIARNVADGAHAVLIMDRAAWHATSKLVMPTNITPILLPSRAPELNPVENIWQYMRANWLSNRVFENYYAIIEAICEAWNNLIEIPDAIISIGMREWAHVGRSE